MNDFTEKEKKWIKDASQLFKRIPKKLMLYSCCSEISVCKLGQPNFEVGAEITGANINCCDVISDVHDDMDFGRKVH